MTNGIDVRSGISAILQTKKRTFPQHVNRISAIDDPCLRRLYYRRAAWDKAEPTPDSLQGVFETGNILEPVIERIVSEVGQACSPKWRIVGSQTPTNDAFLKQYQISGSIDGFLQMMLPKYEHDTLGAWETLGVIDIKTMSGNIYPQINSYDDLAKYPWTRGYRGQLMTYAFAHNLEQCFILMVNKNNLFDMKMIDFGIDMDYLERLLQKAQLINEAIELELPPEGVNDCDICQRCAWLSYCAPSLAVNGNLEIIDDAELEAVLNRIDELEPEAEELKDLEKARDAMLAKGKDIVCGNHMVTWKHVKFEKKPTVACTVEQWRKKIVRMDNRVAEPVEAGT